MAWPSRAGHAGEAHGMALSALLPPK